MKIELKSITRHKGPKKDETLLHGEFKIEISTDTQRSLAEEFIFIDHHNFSSSRDGKNQEI
jgi:hypothetical protein